MSRDSVDWSLLAEVKFILIQKMESKKKDDISYSLNLEAIFQNDKNQQQQQKAVHKSHFSLAANRILPF